MTLHNLERCKDILRFSPNVTDFEADYITLVEGRPIMSVKYCLSVPVFYFWRKLWRTLQRGLSAIAEHIVVLMIQLSNAFCNVVELTDFRHSIW